MNKNILEYTYLPLRDKTTKRPTFEDQIQLDYIFPRDHKLLMTGTIMVTKFNRGKDGISLIIFFDNILAKITVATLIEGSVTMPIFVKFIEALDRNNMLIPFPTFSEGEIRYEHEGFVTLYIPKVFNRNWIFREMTDKGVILSSYLWKDEDIPQVIKDLHKVFNKEFRRNPSRELLNELVNKFNSKVMKKLASLHEQAEKSDYTQMEDSTVNNETNDSPRNNDGNDSPINNEAKDSTINNEGSVESRKLAPVRKIRPKPITPFGSIFKRKFSTSHQLNIELNSAASEIINNLIKLERMTVFIDIDDKNFVADIAIKALIKKFKLEVKEHAKKNGEVLDNIKISTQFIIESEEELFRSCSAIDIINYKDMNYLEKSYIYNWLRKYEERYESFRVVKMIVRYKFLPVNYVRKLVSYIHQREYKKSFSPFKINNKIPQNMDISNWGNVISKTRINMQCSIKQTNMTADIIMYNSQLNIVSVYYKGVGKPIKFLDHGKSNNFTRRFPEHKIKYDFVGGEEVLFTQEINKIKFIEKIKKTENLTHSSNKIKVITMDIETQKIGDEIRIVCISICICEGASTLELSGKSEIGKGNIIKKTFAIWDYNSVDDMIIAAFKFIMRRKYYGYNIYFHNFSQFDSIFIVKTLSNLPNVNVKPIFRDGKLLKLSLRFDISPNLKYRGVIYIFDSMLILPISLAKLGKTFGDNEQSNKSIFPLKYLDGVSDFDYEGSVPELKYFYHPDPLDKEAFEQFQLKYKDYKKSFDSTRKWNLKRELINYCEQDSIVLYNVITTFAQQIYSKYETNTFKYPTLPSIAFAIYRKNFMNILNIPVINGKLYTDIKNAYYGGFVDSYEFYGERVKSYDVNSLYPSAMQKCFMPVGVPTYFEGNTIPLAEIFGFVYVKVSAPNLNKPILPFKPNCYPFTTRYPIGTWEGWYFTEELKNAEKYGYKFEVIKGYIFKKSVIFAEYVNDLYSIKQNVSPNDPWYTISKLLLNSLYGRFGMNPEMNFSEIMFKSELDKFNNDRNVIITESIELGEKIWIQYTKFNEGEESQGFNNISVPIAAAITAWSRIHMANYIMKYSNYIYNIDTDGIKVGCELNPEDVGPKLGQMKDEGDFKEAVFIAPKVYGGITSKNEMVVKVKGLKQLISYWNLKTLLYEEEIQVSQEKWYRDFSNSAIEVKNQLYTLIATSNKRELIRDSVGKLITTRPYMYISGELVTRSPYILYYLPAPLSYLALPAPISYLALPAPISYLALPAVISYLALPAPISYLSLPSPTPVKPVIRGISVIILDLEVNVTTKYSSIRSAAKAINSSKSTILYYEKRKIHGYNIPFKNRYVIEIQR